MGMWLKALTWKQKFYLVIAAICCISLYAGLADYDWYWQVELGKAIVTRFDFNAIYGLHWGDLGVAEYLDHEWLTNVLFYICSLLGEYGISIAKLLICLAYAGATCLYLDVESKSFNDASIFGICAFVFGMSTVFIKVKAYILSVVFLLLEIICLKKYKSGSDKLYFAYMFGLMVVWNNMHSGSIPLFFLVAGVYWLTELRMDKKVLMSLPLYLAGLGITPWGFKLVVFDVMHNFDPVMKEIIQDWRAIDGKTEIGMICTILLLGVIFYMIGTDIKTSAFDLIMCGVVFVMSFQSARHLIYIAPFFYSIVLNNKYEFKLGDNIRFYASFIIVGFAVLALWQGFGSANYKMSYAMNYMEPELVDAIVETNSETCDGLFDDSNIELWSLGLKQFSSGAFPCVRERRLDAYEMLASASDARISELIEKYGLTKFVAVKYNPVIDYVETNGVLYDYLSANDEYELLYDSDYYYYFVRKDLLT